MAIDLDKYPEECGADYWRETVTLDMPYQGQGGSSRTVQPFAKPWSSFVRDLGARAGYDSAAEQQYRAKIAELAAATRLEAAALVAAGNDVREQIMGLASEALEEAEAPAELYSVYATQVKLELKPSLNTADKAFPLSTSDDAVEGSLSDEQRDTLWRKNRQDARAAIAEHVSAAGRALWCAQVGLAQAKSYLANEAAVKDQPLPPGVDFGGPSMPAGSSSGPTFGAGEGSPLSTKLGSIQVMPPETQGASFSGGSGGGGDAERRIDLGEGETSESQLSGGESGVVYAVIGLLAAGLWWGARG